VYVRCLTSLAEYGPIWGTSEKSIARALFGLNQNCSCATGVHVESEREWEQVPRKAAPPPPAPPPPDPPAPRKPKRPKRARSGRYQYKAGRAQAPDDIPVKD
jgi:hypothetical protein